MKGHLDMIPIIVIFKGNPSYLKYVIKQAEKMGNYVILGGERNKD
jgi:hypothetical protein